MQRITRASPARPGRIDAAQTIETAFHRLRALRCSGRAAALVECVEPPARPASPVRPGRRRTARSAPSQRPTFLPASSELLRSHEHGDEVERGDASAIAPASHRCRVIALRPQSHSRTKASVSRNSPPRTASHIRSGIEAPFTPHHADRRSARRPARKFSRGKTGSGRKDRVKIVLRRLPRGAIRRS